jgi:hypothetical protein
LQVRGKERAIPRGDTRFQFLDESVFQRVVRGALILRHWNRVGKFVIARELKSQVGEIDECRAIEQERGELRRSARQFPHIGLPTPFA